MIILTLEVASTEYIYTIQPARNMQRYSLVRWRLNFKARRFFSFNLCEVRKAKLSWLHIINSNFFVLLNSSSIFLGEFSLHMLTSDKLNWMSHGRNSWARELKISARVLIPKSLNPTLRPDLRPNSDDSLCHVMNSCNLQDLRLDLRS